MPQITRQNTTPIQLQTGHTSAASDARLDAVCQWLNETLPQTIEHSILSVKHFGYGGGQDKASRKAARQSEFAAGRFCAQQALSRWNEYGPVGKSKDRSPNWPAGFSGSISHSKNWVWAAASKSDQIRSIGVDTEPIVDATTRSQTWEQAATRTELQTIQALGLDPNTEFTVLFSAKEAFYKCWYPVAKEFFYFKDAIVESCQPGKLTIRPTNDNPISDLQPSHLTVQYFVDAEDVFTVAWLTRPTEKAQKV